MEWKFITTVNVVALCINHIVVGWKREWNIECRMQEVKTLVRDGRHCRVWTDICMDAMVVNLAQQAVKLVRSWILFLMQQYDFHDDVCLAWSLLWNYSRKWCNWQGVGFQEGLGFFIMVFAWIIYSCGLIVRSLGKLDDVLNFRAIMGFSSWHICRNHTLMWSNCLDVLVDLMKSWISKWP